MSHQPQCRFESVVTSHENGLRLTWPVFLQSTIEDIALGVGQTFYWFSRIVFVDLFQLGGVEL